MTGQDDSGKFDISTITTTSPSLDHDFFESDTPLAVWLAGLIAADGCIWRDGRRWALSQSGDDGCVLMRFVQKLINHHGALGARTPNRGKTSYSLTVTSPRMVTSLERRFGITTNKTLHYQWPGLTGEIARGFLRGYIDGDGCVGAYRTPQGGLYLHLSFVGTPGFVTDAMRLFPVPGRYRAIPRCKALAEARYNGRAAWQACSWLYRRVDIFPSRKYLSFQRYRRLILADPPKWLRDQRNRAQIETCLGAGLSIQAAAVEVGVNWRTVYRWRPERATGDSAMMKLWQS